MDKDKKISADLNDIVRQREKVTGSAIRALQNAIIQKEKEIEKQLNELKNKQFGQIWLDAGNELNVFINKN